MSGGLAKGAQPAVTVKPSGAFAARVEAFRGKLLTASNNLAVLLVTASLSFSVWIGTRVWRPSWL
jgi:hypothetical protein